MSMPGCSDPQRMPKGLVIGPLTGQRRGPGADEGADAPEESVVVPSVAVPELDERAADSAARIRAASSALAEASACDSWIAAASSAFVAASACDFPHRAPASLLSLSSSSPRRTAA